MRAKGVALIGSIVIFGASVGQETPGAFDGVWAGTCGPQAEYEFHGLTGKSKPFGRAKNDPCAARAKSITVTQTTAEQIDFRINGADALQGCPDITVTLKRIDVSHLSGVRKMEGVEATCSLTRQ